ncbi:MAG: hypothetical protein B7Y40_05835 [Gammaproteobacteria bacterium 28-57-27]|nr:MAG: hypothetical protein B7Y40_05835 [Gammaproteobacteria bacterium 28-57-27]
MRNLALPLWAGLLCLTAGIILPWQAGVYLRNHVTVTLEQLASNLHAVARVTDYQQGLWRSSAQVSIHSTLLREPVDVHLEMRHGPWLGFKTSTPTAWGWFSIQTNLPQQGGISLFPAQQAVDAWLYADMLGVLHVGTRLHGAIQPLGEEIRLRSLMHNHANQCRGELRLPGFKWLAPTGDLIVADVSVRANLQHEQGAHQGDFSVDALSAAWIVTPNTVKNRQELIPSLPPSILIELPRIDVLLTQSTQLSAAWASARGVNLHALGHTLGMRNNVELGRMNSRLGWRDVNWSVLWSSMDTGQLTRSKIPALNAFTYALGEGEISLEALEISQPQGRIFVTGALRTHTPVQDWRDLELHLHTELNQSALVTWMLDTGQVNSLQTAQEQLESLRRQGWLDDEATPGHLSTTLDLWRGEMSLSKRRVPLTALLQ